MFTRKFMKMPSYNDCAQHTSLLTLVTHTPEQGKIVVKCYIPSREVTFFFCFLVRQNFLNILKSNKYLIIYINGRPICVSDGSRHREAGPEIQQIILLDN